MKNKLILDILQNKVNYGPQIANIYINSQCNLKCEYCWFHSFLNKKKMPNRIIPFSAIQKNINELKELGTKYIVLSSHGEPWLHPQIQSIISYIKNQGLYLRITTNLTFKEKKLRLLFARADFLAVNFSAPEKELYKKIHSPSNSSTFETVVENLSLYSSLYRKRKKPFVEVRYIITKNNYRYIDKMLKLAKKLRIPQIRFRIFDPTPSTRTLLLSKEDYLSLKNMIKRILKKYSNCKTNLEKLYEHIGNEGKVNFQLNRCFVGWLRISLELNGKIGFCCQNDKLIIGNWKKDSIKKAWFSDIANKLRKKLKYDFNFKKREWKNCLFCFMEEENLYIDSILKKFGE